MQMERATEKAAREVERFSSLGALQLQEGQPQKALEAYRHAHQSSLLLGHNGYMQRDSAFNLGAVLISTGSFADGLTYLKQAEPPEGSHDGRSNGDLYYNCGLAYEALRNTTEMKYYYSKALKEYQSETGNVKMAAHVISCLGKAYLACGQFDQAEAHVRDLIQIYEELGDVTKMLQTLAEQAIVLVRMDQVEEAEKVADVCFMRSQDQELSNKTANIFLELSLVYTQICKYDKALQCCHRVLPVVNVQDADLKQIAVLYQNLGVIHNYQQQYQDAIQYHQAAANKYAEMNNRRSQGHCFINLGYAYSQLKDINRAGECFLHSLQAAKDCGSTDTCQEAMETCQEVIERCEEAIERCEEAKETPELSGDRKSEWQSLEALGSVACLDGQLKRSQDYYKSALTVFAKSPDAEHGIVQDRILEKLAKVVELQVYKVDDLQVYKVDDLQVHKLDEPGDLTSQTDIQSRAPNQAQKNLVQRARSQDGGVIAVKKDGTVKYLRVRRSGTLRTFNKVALGLDVSMTPPPATAAQSSNRQTSFSLTHADNEEEEVFSASTLDFSDLEEDDEENVDNGEERDLSNRRQAERLSEPMREMGGARETNSDDEEKYEVLDAMRKVVIRGDARVTSSQTGETTSIHSAVHDQDDSQPESDTETDVTSSPEDTEEDEEEDREDTDNHSTRDRLQPPPPIPLMSQSSSIGPVRTYEVPVKRCVQSEATDHRSTDDTSQDPTDDGNNFFRSGDLEQFSNNKISPFTEDNGYQMEENRLERSATDGPIYETLPIESLQDDNAPESADASPRSAEESENEDTAHARMPKGERDRIELRAFHADMKVRHDHEMKAQDNNRSSTKRTRVCLVM